MKIMSVITATKENFKKDIIGSPLPVLVDFYADWCGPCQMLSPVIAQIAAENPDIRVAKINVDKEVELAQAFGVNTIPTLVALKDGNVINKSVGYNEKSQILKMVRGEN